MEKISLSILPRLRARSNDRSLLNCTGKYTKSELDSGVNTGFSVTPLQLAPKFMNCSRRFIMTTGKHTGWPCYLMALNINFNLTYSAFKGLLSFGLHNALNFWVLGIQRLYFQSHRWSRPLVFIPGLCWVRGAKAEDRNFWEGAAHCQCDSNGDSATAL